MTFEWPALLWFLVLVPLLLVLRYGAARRRTRRSGDLADAHLLGAVVQRPGSGSARWLGILQLTALTLLLLAAARPYANLPLPRNQAAVVIAFDASRSMLANDVDPTRLEVARAGARDFISGVPATTRIGLVSFSDVASVLVPPTHDRDTVLEALEGIGPALNTSLASAVVSGVKLFPGRKTLGTPAELEPPGFSPALPTIPLESLEEELARAENPPPGSIVIFSDGVSNVGNNPNLPTESALDIAAGFAADNGVKLYGVPVGRDGGTVTRIDGEDYFIPYEPDTLERLAERSEGAVIDLEDAAALRELVRDLGTAIRWELAEAEVSSVLTGLALIFMLIAGVLSLHLYRRVP